MIFFFCQYIISGFKDVKNENIKKINKKIKMVYCFDKQYTKVLIIFFTENYLYPSF